MKRGAVKPAPALRPPRLRRGDAIAVVAPAGPVVEARIARGLELLAERYDVHCSRRIYERSGYLAGDDSARAAELMLAFADDKIRAIVCARGGYGVMRILPRLDPALLSRRPKALIGFSDITALHAYAGRAGVASIHAPNCSQLGELPQEDLAAFFSLLEGESGAPIEGLSSVGTSGVVEGPLVGGNLELVCSLVGTPWAFDLRGAVLLLEEVGERPYRIDRALTQLSLSGSLDGVAAVVVGDLVRCAEADGSGPSADEVIAERLVPLGVPVLTGLPVGHGTRNRALGMHVQVRVDGGARRLTPLVAPLS